MQASTSAVPPLQGVVAGDRCFEQRVDALHEARQGGRPEAPEDGGPLTHDEK